jgi:hypothetical protein
VPYRQLTRPRSRALWARGGHFGASQVPECDNLGPGGIDIEHLRTMDVSLTRELREPICTNGSPIQLTARATHQLSGLSAAVLSPLAAGRVGAAFSVRALGTGSWCPGCRLLPGCPGPGTVQAGCGRHDVILYR